MEKGLFNKYKNILYVFLSMLIIGMSICIFFSKNYIDDWYSFISETMVTLLKYFDYGGILKKLLIKNIKHILFVAVICKSIYRKYLKYYIAIFWGITAGMIITVIFMAGNIPLGFTMVLLNLIKIVMFGFAALLLYIKKRNTKYIMALIIIVLMSMIESLIYIKIVARILTS